MGTGEPICSTCNARDERPLFAAVLAVPAATTALADEEQVDVDGSTGRVTPLGT